MSVTLRSFIRLIHHTGLPLIIVVVLAACGGGNTEESTPTTVATPAAGGMVMPTATPLPTATATESVRVFVPGQVLVAIETVRLYADASQQAPVMNEYLSNATFTLLEPSGDYTAYPVTQEGKAWYRLRAADGLVGWVPTDELAPNE